MAKLSNYASKLPTEAESRYIHKLELINNVLSRSVKAPQINAQFHWLTLVISYPTWCNKPVSSLHSAQYKAHSCRSLEAYNQFTSGWVKDVRAYSVEEKCVVAGQVSCSVADE